jgi:hypothetical protein
MRSFWGLALCLCLAACSGPQIQKNSSAITTPYPFGFRAQHQVILTVAGREVDFTGYLLVQGSSWRAMAFSEFGVSLFDMISSPEKGRRVIKTSGIPASYLSRQTADIIEMLFLPVNDRRSTLAQGAERIFCHGNVYEVTCSKERSFKGVKDKVPTHIVLENKKSGLRLEVNLIKFESMKIPEQYFDE